MPHTKQKRFTKTGTVLSNVKVYWIFWGKHWSTAKGQELSKKIDDAVHAIVSEPYLESVMEEYGLQRFETLPKGYVDDAVDPPRNFKDTDVVAEITRLIQKPELAPPPDPQDALYLVIVPHGFLAASNDWSGQEQDVGRHSFFQHGDKTLYYGWVLSGREEATYERITASLSEEVVEAITDPEPPTGWVTRDADGTFEELCDVCEGITHKLNDGKGPLVKTYYSNKKEDCFP